MPHAFYPAHPARSINLGFIAFAVGGLAGMTTPQYAGRWGHHKTLLALAIASLLPAAFVMCTPSGEFPEPRGGDLMLLLADVRIGLIAVIAALCFPLDTMLGPWVRRYVVEHAHRRSGAVVMAVGFWAAFLGTRLFAGLTLPTGWEHVWIVVWAVLAVIIFSNMLGAYSPGTNMVGLWLTGACCAPLMPTLLGLALQINSDSPGLVLGLTAAAGMLGNLLVLRWIDASRPECMTKTSLRGATALAVVLLVPALVLAVIGII
jgi:quinol-cytochrome oxidoreductase complex cytochrome b subunit